MMKVKLFRFYFLFLVLASALFSCENNTLTHESFQDNDIKNERRPEERHPVEPNESSKGKKQPRRISRSSSLC